MRTGKTIFAAFFLCALLAPSIAAEAGVLAEHSGASNPATEGWTWNTVGLPSANTYAVFNDLGTTDAWAVDDNGTTALGVWEASLTPAEATEAATRGWVLTANLRVVDISSTGGAMVLGYYTGSKRFLLDFGVQPDGDATVSMFGNAGVFASEGSGAVYHEYALLYQPFAGTANLFVDGALALSNLVGQANGSAPYVTFGAASGNRTGQANFNLVSFASVPEPSTLVLGAVGGLLCLAAGRRRRKEGRSVRRPKFSDLWESLRLRRH